MDPGVGRVGNVLPVRGMLKGSVGDIMGTLSDSDRGGVGTPASPKASFASKVFMSSTIFKSSSENSSLAGDSGSVGAKSSR